MKYKYQTQKGTKKKKTSWKDLSVNSKQNKDNFRNAALFAEL